MIRVGIDNGLDGAIVALDDLDRPVVAEVMPVIPGRKRALDYKALWAILLGVRSLARDEEVYAVLEYAQVLPRQGAVSGFTTGTGFGAVQMALVGTGFSFDILRPKKWQEALGIRGRGTAKDQRRADIKQQVIQLVQRRVPLLDLAPGKKRKPHDGLADACAMALASRAVRVGGRLAPPPPIKRVSA